MIRAVAFDWGGIFTEGTFDSDAVANLAALLEVAEERLEGVYYPLMAHFEAGEFGLEEFVARFRQESGLTFDEGEFRDTFLASGRDRPRMYEVLNAIPRSYRVAVLSNNVPVLCDRVRSDPRMERVETFLFSNELGVRKPAEAAYRRLREAVDLPAGEVLFIDDSEANIAACRELGFTGIHFRDFEQFGSELSRLVPELAPTGNDG